MAVEKKKTTKKATKKTVNKPTEVIEENNPYGELVGVISGMYKGFLNEGFSEDQSLELVKAVMQCPAMAPQRMSLF